MIKLRLINFFHIYKPNLDWTWFWESATSKFNYFFTGQYFKCIANFGELFCPAHVPCRNESRTGRRRFLSTNIRLPDYRREALQNIRTNYVSGLENRIYSWSQCHFHLYVSLSWLSILRRPWFITPHTCPCHDKHNFRHESWSMRFTKVKVLRVACFLSLFRWKSHLERKGCRTINAVNEP